MNHEEQKSIDDLYTKLQSLLSLVRLVDYHVILIQSHVLTLNCNSRYRHYWVNFLMLILPVGVGLMEIITEPDFRSSDEAGAFVKELQLILQTIGTCDGKMEGDA